MKDLLPPNHAACPLETLTGGLLRNAEIVDTTGGAYRDPRAVGKRRIVVYDHSLDRAGIRPSLRRLENIMHDALSRADLLFVYDTRPVYSERIEWIAKEAGMAEIGRFPHGWRVYVADGQIARTHANVRQLRRLHITPNGTWCEATDTHGAAVLFCTSPVTLREVRATLAASVLQATPGRPIAIQRRLLAFDATNSPRPLALIDAGECERAVERARPLIARLHAHGLIHGGIDEDTLWVGSDGAVGLTGFRRAIQDGDGWTQWHFKRWNTNVRTRRIDYAGLDEILKRRRG